MALYQHAKKSILYGTYGSVYLSIQTTYNKDLYNNTNTHLTTLPRSIYNGDCNRWDCYNI